MKSNHIKLSTLLCFLLFTFSCKEKYTAPEITEPHNYLVVDGMIVSGDVSSITLSRSRNINSNAPLKYETNAIVTLEAETGGVIPFVHLMNGNYSIGVTTLNTSLKYFVRIRVGGKEYRTDLFPVKQTPQIDTVDYKIDVGGLHMQVSTHDAQNATRFYKWDYVETWQYTSRQPTFLEYKNDTLLPIFVSPFYTCYRTVPSSTINVGTSGTLANDVISNFPLNFIEDTSSRLMIKYSLLVKQYAITEDAYDFWLNVKKSSEQLGSLFDPQPTQLSGNIHCITNPDEPVIGYITASTVTQKRVFIDKNSLPSNFLFSYPATCITDTMFKTIKGPPPIPPGPLNVLKDRFFEIFSTGKNLPIAWYPIEGGYWTYSSKECLDCRVKGGVTQKPPFWP